MNATRDPIDVAFGTIIRARRTAQRMSLEELGRQVGVTYQQIQKYETGANRVSVSTAKRMAKAFGCSFADLAAFIDDAEPAPESSAPSVSNIGLVDRKLGRLDNLPDHIRAPLSALVDALKDRNGPVAARLVELPARALTHVSSENL